MMTPDIVAANLQSVQRRIAQAAESVGRSADEVELVVVTKGRTLDQIRAVYQAGQRDIGENRVEEALTKQEALADLAEIKWHMVGHIQSRKTADVAVFADCVHSVDRVKIARRLNDQYAGDQPLPIFLECNVSGEESKYGWDMAGESEWLRMVEDLEGMLAYERLDIQGLMTMAPWTDDDQIVRSTFRRLKDLRDFLQEQVGRAFPSLSMGMTADFEIAVQEGATHVRLGTAIFEADSRHP
jgi:pyridoxal phosphate enzyme (YggS family)